MRFHVVGLPHTVTSKRFLPCAYTQKVLKFCQMMTKRGHHVIHYGAEGVDPAELKRGDGTFEHVDVVSTAEQQRWWPDFDIAKGFPYVFQSRAEWWITMAVNTAMHIRDNYDPTDILCVIAGAGCHSEIPRILNSMKRPLKCVEFGVGYIGVFADYKVYESNAQRQWVHGIQWARADRDGDQQAKVKWDDGWHYDAVIPNYFDPEDFLPAQEPKDYFLFMGRLVRRKGVMTAIAAARELGTKLLIAGQDGRMDGRRLISTELDVELPPNVEYVGTITDAKERAELISGAIGMFVPTQYLEPFGGVFAEGLMSGVPVLTSDWGAFPEFVRHGTDGFLCNILGDYVLGAQGLLERGFPWRPKIQEEAVRRFGMDEIGFKYENYFRRLQTVDGRGWNTLWNEEVTHGDTIPAAADDADSEPSR